LIATAVGDGKAKTLNLSLTPPATITLMVA